jgi:sugar phosphate isomerase/epimerase
LKLSCVDALAPGETLKDKFDNLKRYGFEGIEIWASIGNSEELAKEIRGIAFRSKVKVSSVIVVNEAFYRPLDSLEAKQAKCEVIKESLRLAAATGAVSLVIPEYAPQFSPPIFVPPSPSDAEKSLLLELLEDVGRYAQQIGTTLVLEPINRYETRFFHTVDEAVEICKEVGSPNIKVMADLFQMNIEERDIAESIRRAGKYIHYVHLSDSNRLLPGYGHIDFRSAFGALKEIGYEGYMGLECAISGKPDDELPRCVKYLKAINSGCRSGKRIGGVNK